MLRPGVIIVFVAGAMLVERVLWGAAEQRDEKHFSTQYARSVTQLSNVCLWVAIMLGLPMVLAGLADRYASTRIVIATFVGSAVLSAVVSVGLWRARPNLRFDPVFWDNEARVGTRGRREGVTVLIAALALTCFLGLLLLRSR